MGLWELRDTLLRADDEHPGAAGWENIEGGRPGYVTEVCKKYLMEMLQMEPRSNLVDLWMSDYLVKRVGWGGLGITIRGGPDHHKPYYCSFCKEEQPGEEVEEDNGSIGARKLEPLEHMRELGSHILMRHSERFEENWVTGGGVIKAIGDRRVLKPFWKVVRALDE